MLWPWRWWTYIWNYNGIILSKPLRIFEFCTYMLFAPSTYMAHFCSFCLNLEKMDSPISFNNPVIWKHKITLLDSDLQKRLIYWIYINFNSNTPVLSEVGHADISRSLLPTQTQWCNQLNYSDVFLICVMIKPSLYKTSIEPTSRYLLWQFSNIFFTDYLIFDNSYSWTATKKLFYMIDVYTDDEDLDYEEETASK